MPSSVVVPARKAGKYLPELFAAMSFDLRVDDRGTYHLTQCPTRPDTAKMVTLSLRDLSDKLACDSCLRAYRLSLLGPEGLLLDRVADLIHHMSRSAKDLGGDVRKTLRMQEAVQKHLTACTNLLGETIPRRKVSYQDMLSISDKETLQSFFDTVNAELKRLRGLLRAPEEVERVLEEVKVAMGVQDLPVDSSLALVGFAPAAITPTWTKLHTAIFEQLSVRSAPLVLLVPRYVADYLFFATNYSNNNIVASASVAGLSPEIIETAAELWDPTSLTSGAPTALATLMGAVEAAKATVR